ncbi:MAG: hypothetical protein ACRD0A_21195 [Acidimicrobiales bacterium]
MERERRERLNQIMAGIADGDGARLFDLWDEFGGDLRATMCAHARMRGHDRLTHGALDDLAGEAWLAMRGLAGSWRPDGALPWVWARARLAAIVDEVLGPAVRPVLTVGEREVAVEVTAVAFLGAEPPRVETLHGLATVHERCRLLRMAMDEALAPEEQELLLDYVVQCGSGDPSPSITVGAVFGLQPATVRQRVVRARRRLATTIAGDDRYAPLAGVALLRSGRNRRAA